MDDRDDEKLDHYFASIDDFLNSKYTSEDELDAINNTNTMELHFNKPGFDLAIIITDKNLITSIPEFQIPFQSKYCLTTHVIYLPDIKRIKFCIRDLKLAEILYAIVVGKTSKEDDDYDVYILNPIIERQRRMDYKQLVDLICADFANYKNQLKTMFRRPERSPHAVSNHIDGFIEPTSEIRYYLCLLFDHRMLSHNELMSLKSFIQTRKEAIETLGNRPVNYAMNDRPLPPFRQEKYKYYVYDCKLSISKELTVVVPNEPCAINPHLIPRTPLNSDISITQSHAVSNQLMVTNVTSKSAIITGSPKLYTQVNPTNQIAKIPVIVTDDIPLPPPLPIQYTPNKTIGQTCPARNLFLQNNKLNNATDSNLNPPVNKVAPALQVAHPQSNIISPPVSVMKVTPIKVIGTNSSVQKVFPLQQSPGLHQPITALSSQTGNIPYLQSPIRHVTPISQVNIIPSKPQTQKVSPLSKTNNVSQNINTYNPQSITPHPPDMTHKNPSPQQTVSCSPQSPDIDNHGQQGIKLSVQSIPPPETKAPSKPLKRKIQFSISAATKLPQHTHSNVSNKSIPNSNVPEKKVKSKVIVKETPNTISEMESSMNCQIIACNNSPDKARDINSASNTAVSDLNRDGISMEYILSPVSDDINYKDIKKEIIEIDLTDDVINEEEGFSSPPMKKPKYNVPLQTPLTPASPVRYQIDIADDQSASLPKSPKMSCNAFINLLKFVISMSPLSLPPQNVVILMMKKCLSDMETYMTNKGNKGYIAVDPSTCKIRGFKEIVIIIKNVCEEPLSNKQNLNDLEFMWLTFPRNLSMDSVTVVFYKLMKMLELSKLDSNLNDILVNMIQSLQTVVHYNFQLWDTNTTPSNYLNHFPSMLNEYFDLKYELHHLNLALPPPEPVSVVFNTDIDKTIVENKIKFIVGNLMEYFINSINSINYQLDCNTMEVIYNSIRSLRFCLRKICIRALPERLQKPIQFIAPGNMMDRTLELLDEINYAVREVSLLNCILFTKKHYDLINLLLDFSIKIEKSVAVDSEADSDQFDKKYLIHIEPMLFVHEFASTIKTAVYPYHPDTEIDVFKEALKNRWIDTLHQAFKGIPPEPDGLRISKEVIYFLPKGWGKRAFEEAVTTAAMLCYCDWEKMLTGTEVTQARLVYADVRNSYLLWLTRNNLEHKKAAELMTANQKRLDAIIMKSSS